MANVWNGPTRPSAMNPATAIKKKKLPPMPKRTMPSKKGC